MKAIIFALICASAANAWAGVTDCSRPAGSLPYPLRAAGQSDPQNPIEHIVVLMQENHSFDQYFGRLAQSKFYGKEIDGLPNPRQNKTRGGIWFSTYHERNLCPFDPDHTWDGEHLSWNHGGADGFVRVNGPEIMGHYDETDLPFYYALANEFAVGDRYFCSTLTQTLPNRFFLLTASAFGHIRNDLPEPETEYSQTTLMDILNRYKVSWKYYKDAPGYLSFFQPLYLASQDKMASVADFAHDANANTLPQVSFIDSSFEGEDEHPDGNIQEGQKICRNADCRVDREPRLEKLGPVSDVRREWRIL